MTPDPRRKPAHGRRSLRSRCSRPAPPSAEPALWSRERPREHRLHVRLGARAAGGRIRDRRQAGGRLEGRRKRVHGNRLRRGQRRGNAGHGHAGARAWIPKAATSSTLLGPDADRAQATRPRGRACRLEPLAQFEPWFAGMMLSIMALQQHGFDIEHGVEQIIEAAARTDRQADLRARNAGRAARHASTPCRPSSRRVPAPVDRRGGRGRDRQVEPMIAAWRDGDEAGLERSLDGRGLRAAIPSSPRRWSTSATSAGPTRCRRCWMATEDVLLVVGAMHLVGDRGLPALLREARPQGRAELIRTRACPISRKRRAYIAGGVNSPVRAFRSVGGEPLFIRRARGAASTTEDGRRVHRLRRLLGPDDPRPRASRRDRGGHAPRCRRPVVRRADGDRDRARAQDRRDSCRRSSCCAW